jgi:hypothetical protein
MNVFQKKNTSKVARGKKNSCVVMRISLCDEGSSSDE